MKLTIQAIKGIPKNTIIQEIEYNDLTIASIFNYKNYKLDISYFKDRYEELKG